MPAQPISRRLLLGATTAVLLTGCDDEPAEPSRSTATTGAGSEPTGGGTGSAGTGTSPGTETSGDDLLVADAVASARRLTGDYAALVARHPDTRRATAPLRAHLREHLLALGDGGSTARPARAERSRRRAIRGVRDAERTAAAARVEGAVAAASGDLARALASIAASHAQHATVLEDL